jgi:hypothetical protein
MLRFQERFLPRLVSKRNLRNHDTLVRGDLIRISPLSLSRVVVRPENSNAQPS